MKRTVILSYDASIAFKEAYEKANQRQFKEDFIWEAIEASGLGHLEKKPVKSTLLISTDEFPDRYLEIAALLRKEFPGLYFVAGLICQVADQDLYIEECNPTSVNELKDFLEARAEKEPQHMTKFKPKK